MFSLHTPPGSDPPENPVSFQPGKHAQRSTLNAEVIATRGLPTSSDLPILPPTSTLPLMNYEHIITIEADKRGGKPCIRGLRITVYDVLDYLAGGMTEQEILADFPDLTAEDLKACLAFAADRERRLYRTHAA